MLSIFESLKRGFNAETLKDDWENKYGVKKAFFNQNKEIIFELIDKGVRYSDILKVLESEGLPIKPEHFRRLVMQERRAQTVKASASAAPALPSPSSANLTTQTIATSKNETEIVDDVEEARKLYLAENKRIKGLNIPDKEKREMLKTLSDNYSNSQNPLRRKNK